MKNYTKHIMLVLVTSLLFPMDLLGLKPTITGLQFFYSYDTKVFIEVIPDEIMVVKNKNIRKEDFELAINSIGGEMKYEWYNDELCTIYVDSLNQDFVKTKLLGNDMVRSVYPKVVTLMDLEYSKKNVLFTPSHLGITNKIVLKYKEGTQGIVKERLIEQYGLQKESTNSVFEVMSINKYKDVIGISRELYETGCFEFVCPDIVCPISFHDDRAYYPNDPFFQKQRSLHNTGQMVNGHQGYVDADIDLPEAWSLTMGSEDVVIAVIDEGVTSNHPDLPNIRQIRLEGSNFGAGNTDDPSPIGNANHGNACAGIIAATANNEQGIAGVAPNCKIMRVRIDNTTTTTQTSSAIIYAVENGANIISNSWGYNTVAILPQIKAAIEYAINNNVFVVFSAGNSAEHTINYDGQVCFPANLHLPGMICVGASDRYDQQSDYSPTDTCIDIVAPSHKAYPRQYDDYYHLYTGIQGENLDMWTIDIPGNSGYNPWPIDESSYYSVGEEMPNTGTNYLSYTGYFGGTSYSCPIVAGVAALLLSIRPELTPLLLYKVLTNTADKIGGYNYDVDGRCNETGYGRVNANNAVWAVCDTTFLQQETIAHVSRTVVGCDVLMEDDAVVFNSTLNIRARNATKIAKHFFVGYNSSLSIKKY